MSFQHKTNVGVFVSCFKVKSCEEEKVTLRAAFTVCSATIYLEEECKNRRERKRLKIKFIVLTGRRAKWGLEQQNFS